MKESYDHREGALREIESVRTYKGKETDADELTPEMKEVRDTLAVSYVVRERTVKRD